MAYGRKMRMRALLQITLVFVKVDLAPLPIETLEPYLSISPGAKLLQGEWENTAAALLIQRKLISNKRKHYLNHSLCQTNN